VLVFFAQFSLREITLNTVIFCLVILAKYNDDDNIKKGTASIVAATTMTNKDRVNKQQVTINW